MSDTMKDGTPIAKRWASFYMTVSTSEDPDASTFINLIEELSRAEVERDVLKAEIALGDEMYNAIYAKFEGCPHAQQDNAICGCSFDHKDDVCVLHAPQLKKALAKVARLEAPVSDMEQLLWEALLSISKMQGSGVCVDVARAAIAARAKEQPCSE